LPGRAFISAWVQNAAMTSQSNKDKKKLVTLSLKYRTVIAFLIVSSFAIDYSQGTSVE